MEMSLQLSWPAVSVRDRGQDQSRTSPCQRLAASLSWNWANFFQSKGCRIREAAKHVEAIGVGFWIRVQYPAPPPKTQVRTACGSGRALPPMWNDTDIPLGHLITFRTYGSWVHGDERGSVPPT